MLVKYMGLLISVRCKALVGFKCMKNATNMTDQWKLFGVNKHFHVTFLIPCIDRCIIIGLL